MAEKYVERRNCEPIEAYPSISVQRDTSYPENLEER